MEFGVCSMAEQLALQAPATGQHVGERIKPNKDDDEDAEDGVDEYPNGDCTVPDDNRDDDASLIDEYFGLHDDVTTTSGSGGGVVPEMTRAYDVQWLDQATTAAPTVVTSEPRHFVSGEEILNRKYFDFADLGAYGTTGLEPRSPPPCYPTKLRENADLFSENGNGTRVGTFYAGSSYSAADAYFAQYGAVGSFPVIIDQSRYGSGGIATGGVPSDGHQQYYLPTSGTGSGNSCGGCLSVDVRGFGATMLRPIGFQASAPTWSAAYRQ